MPPRRVGLGALVIAETRALGRNLALLVGAMALLLFLALVLVMGLKDNDGFDLFLLAAFLLAPTLFGPFACHALVADRATRFDESLFTTPIAKRTYFLARTLVPLLAGAAYLAAQVPVLALVALVVGTGAAPFESLVAGGLLLVASVSVGLACAAFLGERSPAAATTTATIVLLLSLLATLLLAPVPGSPPILARVLHASPHVLAREAVGLSTSGLAHASPATALLALLLGSGALWASAAWRFGRPPGEVGRSARPRAALALLVVAILAPPMLAGAADALVAVPDDEPPPAWGPVSGAILPRGVNVARADFFGFPVDDDGALAFGKANARDLVVLLHEPPEASVTSLRVELHAPPGLRITGVPATIQTLEPDGQHPYHEGPPALGEAPDGIGPYVRIPVTLEPTQASWLARERFYLTLRVSYVAGGQPVDAATTLVEEAAVESALALVALVALPAPALVGASAWARLRRRRSA